MTAVLLVLVAQALDGLTFLLAVDRWGIGAESNPLARLVVEHAGLAGLMGLKLIAAVMAAGIVHRLRWRSALVVGVGVGIIGAASNTLALAL